LIDLVLRTVLLSSDAYGDGNVDMSYPPAGYNSDPSETVDEHTRYLRFFLDNAARLHSAGRLLRDRHSKELLSSLILFRILGYRRVKVHVDRDALESARAKSFALPPVTSALVIPGLPLFHYEIYSGGKRLRVDCMRENLVFSFFLRQYYFKRANIGISPSPGDVVVDAGGCFGDTAIEFADAVGGNGHVYSFEVLSSHLDIIRYNIGQNPGFTNVTLYPFALGQRDEQGDNPSGPPNPGYSLLDTENRARIRSLDSLVKDGSIRRVDFLKMDIEGFELPALRGAIETIRRYSPKLAISIYHTWEDHFAIPEFIESLGLGYRMYLENYTLTDGETILYATCAGGSESDE
jgi:FkbM family methyltransferase